MSSTAAPIPSIRLASITADQTTNEIASNARLPAKNVAESGALGSSDSVVSGPRGLRAEGAVAIRSEPTPAATSGALALPAARATASLDETRAAAVANPSTLPASARLAAISHAYWEQKLASSPDYASSLGDDRYNDRWSDLSPEGIARDLEAKKQLQKDLAAVPRAELSPEDRTSYDLLEYNLQDELEEAALLPWESSLTQFLGIHIDIPAEICTFPFTTEKHFDDYAARLEKLPTLMAQTLASLRLGVAHGVVPPAYLLNKVVDQVTNVIKDASPFLAPLEKLPESLAPEVAKRLRARIEQAVTEQVVGSYATLLKFLREEYVPHGRTMPGLWGTTDGDKRYAFYVKHFTTTQMTPDEIHDLGQREVARIEGEMLTIAKELGYADLAAFRQAIHTMDAIKPKCAQDIVDRYKSYLELIKPKLPELFGRLPKAAFEVVETEPFRAADAADAEYREPAPDGSRPGRIYINTSKPQERSLLCCESTAYHEGLPGHHMQLAIAQESTGLPEFRKYGFSVAYGEGWALYCESLGKDIGLYQDLISDYGRLNDEILRAIRLVVDTGIHAKRWTRDEAVAFFRTHSSIDEISIQSETDRYTAWPGQALGYKIGQLKLRELRERARSALGADFDIRKFHDLVLGGGSMPLDILERRVDAWIASGAR